jgi:hypothetical protein
VWSIAMKGESTPLFRTDPDGDQVPLATMQVVILDYAHERGRTYYAGAYNADNVKPPVCWSNDGIVPDQSVAEKQHETCAGCPQSIKGSRTTDNGKATAACSQHRMLAIVPAQDLGFTPLRLKIPITSDWDGQSPDLQMQLLFAFSNYLKFLQARGVPHTASLVTKMKFDPNVTYPKILFSPSRWLTADEAARAKAAADSDIVKNLLHGTWTPAGVDGTRLTSPETIAAKVEAVMPPAKVQSPTPAAAAQSQPKAAAPKKPKPPVEDDDGSFNIKGLTASAPAPATPAPVKAPATPKTVPTAQSVEVPPEIAGMLEEWGED